MVWYAFGQVELDADGYVLRRAGEEVTLQPKVFDVLRYLVEHRGRLISKTELLDALWPNEYVNEAVVTWSISHIRRALGQERLDKAPIETVHARGYRFSAEVVVNSGPQLAAAHPVVRVGSDVPTFVGRERVAAELQQCLEETIAGHGSLCALTGEPGIGKTRCTEELMKRAAELGMLPLFGRCPQGTGTPPLWPLDGVLASARDDLASKARAEIAALAGDKARSAGARFAAVEHVTQALQQLAASRPVLVVLDDVHWSDSATLQWLSFVAGELREQPMCVVFTLRDRDIDASHPNERQIRQVLRYTRAIPLGSLERDHLAELIESICGKRPEPELAEAVRKASGGVPLFALEVIRTLAREHGEQPAGGWRPEMVRVPELARDLLRERLRALPGATFELLTQASAIGESFDLSLLSGLAQLEPEALLEQLSRAIADGHVVCDAPHVYRFAHALFQSVLYDDIPPEQRVVLHRKLGKLLRARPEERRQLGEIARHYYLSLPAGEQEDALRFAREAGQVALSRLAFDDAVIYFGWALEAQLFTNSVTAHVDPRARAELLLSLAAVERSAGRTHEASNTAARVIELSLQHELDDLVAVATRLRRPTVALATLPDQLAREALELVLTRNAEGSSPVRITALAQLACVPPYEPDLSTSKRLSSEAVALAERSEHREAQFEALRARLFSLSGPDDLNAALQICDRMFALDRSGPHSWLVMDARIYAVNSYLQLGRIGEADGALRDANSLVGAQWGEASFYCQRMLAQRRFQDGHFAEAEAMWSKACTRAGRAGVAYAEAMRDAQQLFLEVERDGAAAVFDKKRPTLCKAQENPRLTQLHVARIAAEAGALDVVRAQLVTLGEPSQWTRTVGYVHGLSSLAVCAAALADQARCEQLLPLLSPYHEQNALDAMGYYLGSVAHFVGLLELTLGRTDAARTHFAQALAHNRAMGYRAGVVRTLLAIGRLEASTRNTALARESFEAARKDAEQLGMRGMATEALKAIAKVATARS
jgi:DNA-binding winged helix-turn-helix (wHTH) protein/tetratricopeptide (TPR) repeat protein